MDLLLIMDPRDDDGGVIAPDVRGDRKVARDLAFL
jgi:hypothetical protein